MVCSLCGNSGHDDMQCPCFGYVGGEYLPPVEVCHEETPGFRRTAAEEFSTFQAAAAPPPDTRSSGPRT